MLFGKEIFMGILVSSVIPNSPAQKSGIMPGDILLSINGQEIGDVLDYQFYATDPKLTIKLERGGKRFSVRVKKAEYEEFGVESETYLMDQQRHCRNKCVFCFIDQLPKGLRDTLYFKDDDTRLSFLFGNYITLTNIGQHEIDRIIKMKISPVNISVHTTNPELRVQMMNNKHAGEALRYMEQLARAGIAMNCQLVLCPGLNDGEELRRSLNDLEKLYPAVQSVACVPVGLSKYRDGLYPLRPFTKEEARAVVELVNDYGDRCEAQYGTRLFYPADEFFLKSETPLPDYDYFGEYSQLENGVGMMTLLRHDFMTALDTLEESDRPVSVSIATGTAAFDFIRNLVDELKKKWHNLECKVYAVRNDFLGENITVSGLVTGRDLIAQLKAQPLGDRLLFPSSMLRHEGDLFLDDVTPEEVAKQLEVSAIPVPNDGCALLEALTGLKLEESCDDGDVIIAKQKGI